MFSGVIGQELSKGVQPLCVTLTGPLVDMVPVSAESSPKPMGRARVLWAILAGPDPGKSRVIRRQGLASHRLLHTQAQAQTISSPRKAGSPPSRSASPRAA